MRPKKESSGTRCQHSNLLLCMVLTVWIWKFRPLSDNEGRTIATGAKKKKKKKKKRSEASDGRCTDFLSPVFWLMIRPL